MDIVPDHRPDGETLKRLAHRLLEQTRDRLVLLARRALLAHLLVHYRGSIDDVRDRIPVPVGIDPKFFGCVPTPLAKAGIIRHVGYVRTRRPVGHARVVSVWELADRGAAFTWLADNPVPTDAPAVAEGGAS